MMDLYEKTTFECSKLITQHYSTSFTLGIQTLHKKLHMPIYAIYGFVRYADEIVDTFHDHDKASLLSRFKADTYQAIAEGISLNPVLHSFQKVANQYHIEHELIEAFLVSMKMDLDNETHDQQSYQEYIFGSAEVVGLMCLRVFCQGDKEAYAKLKHPAKALGAAFQKVNFLRDMKSDFQERGRVYFPGVNFTAFDTDAKTLIEQDIEKDFQEAYKGIIQLPREAKAGVYLAYVYYLKLFNKIKSTDVSIIQHERVRVPDFKKVFLLMGTLLKSKLRYI